jgi:tetratricopeptide (TPR) repeat protein/predicted transcriptional regulator
MNADRLLVLVAEREEILETLTDGPLAPRDVVDRVDASRSTFNRAIRELDDAGLVDRTSGDCTLTLTGQLMLDRYRRFRQETDAIAAADRALAPLSRDAPIDPAALVDADIHLSDGSTPYRPEERLHEVVRTASRYRAVLPALDDPRHVRLLYEHVITDGLPAALVVPRTLVDSLSDRFPRRLAAMAETGDFILRAGDVPPFGVVVAETDDGDGATVALAVFGNPGIHAVAVADTDRASEWAERLLEDCYSGSRSVTDEFRQHADGGVVLNGRAAGGLDLPVALEREGFVRLSRDFFADRRVADPTTAWRAGLDLAEVHTGYAVERVVESAADPTADDPDRTGDGTNTGTETLAERLTDRLAAGEDCVLVGPPGSGKSTTCKRVATEWHAADRGPVLYRESGRGAAFEDIEGLLATVENAEGQVLVVVEDAVRPEANAVFEALDRRQGGGSDVVFLLDAREEEWRDPPAELRIDQSALTIETMPSLLDRDYGRLVEHFERTASVEVDVPAERLREEVRSAALGAVDDREGDSVPGELLLFTHRLAAYADPLADEGRTTLEADAASVLDAAMDCGEGALDVAVGANLLNAAGVPFGPTLLQVVTVAGTDSGTGPGAGGATTDGHDSFEAALAILDGQVLFGTDDGTYRTVHEAWSVAFLNALQERVGEADARERVSRVATRILAPADDSALRGRLRRPSQNGRGLDGVETDPSGWADRTVEALFGLANGRPKLAALLGGADGPTVGLPAACESVTASDCRVWLGRSFLDAGDYDRAEAAFRGLPDNGQYSVERRIGLGRAATGGGEFDTARHHAETCLALAEDRDDLVAAARARRLLGQTAYHQGEFDCARERLEAAVSAFRDAGDGRRTARTLATLGNVAQRRGNYDQAERHHQQSLGIAREIGDRQQETHCLNGLGGVAQSRGDTDRAEQFYHESLNISRETGSRRYEAMALHNLGLVVQRQGELDSAEQYISESLHIRREIGDRSGLTHSLTGLAGVAAQQGNHDRAERYYEETLEMAREIGNRHAEATALLNLGDSARNRGDPGRASEYLEQAREAMQEIDDPMGETVAVAYLGELAHDTGDRETARRRLRTASDRFAELGAVDRLLDALGALADLERDAGNHERAHEHCERALEAVETADADLADRRADFETRMAALGDTADARVEASAEGDTDPQVE